MGINKLNTTAISSISKWNTVTFTGLSKWSGVALDLATDRGSWTIQTTSGSQAFTMYVAGASSLAINWGDGNSNTYTGSDGNKSHTYTNAGTYTVKITGGTATHIAFGAGGCTPARMRTIVTPFADSLGLTTAAYMFSQCSGITSWCTDFFTSASAGVTSFQEMFYLVYDFNEPINGWDTSSCTRIDYMLIATSFNQPLNSWSTGLFGNCVGALANTPFNQSLASWNVTGVGTMNSFLANTTLSTANYDATLISWADQDVPDGIDCNMGNAKYSAGTAATARSHLTTTHSWSISDGGQA